MMSLGLTTAERRAYHRALATSRPVGLRVRILDRDERNPITICDIGYEDSTVLDGQVTVDASADVTRSLTLTLLDPDEKLHLDPSSPSRRALFPDRFVAVARRDWVEELGRWFSCPVFWGPISRFERFSNRVEIEGQGKESLALAPLVAWEPRTYRKGREVVATIRSVLHDRGERRFSLPEVRRRLPTELGIGRHDEPWLVARRLARSIDRQIFYDGLGRARVRRIPERRLFTFHAVDRANRPAPVVLSDPQISYDFAELRNVIEVLGPEPKKGQRRIRYVARPPRAHPLSPASLGRNGEPRRLVEVIENDKIKRRADAQAIAERRLRDRLRIGLVVAFESLPVPHLEERDLVALVSDLGTFAFRLERFTIPLSASGRMTVGALRRARMSRRRG